MKRILLFVLIILFSFGGLVAQRRGGRGLVDRSQQSESYLVFTIGPEYCYSDTQGAILKQISLNNNDFSIGYRKTFANNLGYKFAFNYSNFSGNDDDSKYVRRYFYTSNVLQLSIQGEYSIKIGKRYYYRPTPNSIYGFAGAGMLKSAADLKIGNDYRGNYIYKTKNVTPFVQSDYAPFVHFGFGYQYNLNNNFIIGGEINCRYAFSDYIDGFKPPTIETYNGKKAVSKSNDVMGGISFSVSYLLGSAYLKRN